jgi:beta-galactosidase
MPSLAEFAVVNQPILFAVSANSCTLTSRYQSITTGHLRFFVTIEVDGTAVLDEPLAVPALAPGATCTVNLPAPPHQKPAPGGEAWLTVRAELDTCAPWAEEGHVVAWHQVLLSEGEAEAAATERQLRWSSVELVRPGSSTDADAIKLGAAEFEPRTGRLVKFQGTEIAGPQVELWRAPTDNDRGASSGSYELARPEDTNGMGVPAPSSEKRWRRRGLDRLQHRVQSVSVTPSELTTRVRVSAANSARYVDLTTRWLIDPQQQGILQLKVQLVPSLDWDCTWPRVGVRFDLPPTLRKAAWFGTGPHENYPDSAAAARVGRFTSSIDAMTVKYSRPQETGHRAALRWLRLTDDAGTTISLRTLPRSDLPRPGFTLTRHTPQQIERAAHPHELPESRHVYLFVDSAVHGLGSRACGIDVLPRHALWPGRHEFGLAFETT